MTSETSRTVMTIADSVFVMKVGRCPVERSLVRRRLRSRAHDFSTYSTGRPSPRRSAKADYRMWQLAMN